MNTHFFLTTSVAQVCSRLKEVFVDKKNAPVLAHRSVLIDWLTRWRYNTELHDCIVPPSGRLVKVYPDGGSKNMGTTKKKPVRRVSINRRVGLPKPRVFYGKTKAEAERKYQQAVQDYQLEC